MSALTNSCGANQAQDFFEVTNTGSTSVTVSDLTVKLWVDDTSAANIVPAISTGGCLANSNGCYHQVANVTASATRFAPACGTDPNHQANWEIVISNTDSSALPAGAKWTNLQTMIQLSNFGNFVPGTGKWYSPCLSGSNYVPDNHFAVYVKGSLAFSSGIGAPPCRAPHGTQQLSGHVTPQITKTPVVGPVPQNTVLQLSIGLPVPNADGLKALAHNVADPTSASYRQFLTVDQFTTQFGPSQVAYQSVVSWAQSHGLTVTHTYPNRLQVNVSGTAAVVEQALYVNLISRVRADGTKFYAPDREPSLDLSTPVDYIEHLNDFFVPKPQVGSGVSGLYRGSDYRNAYASCAPTLDGTGQIIGLLGGEGFSLGDVSLYASDSGIAPVPSVVSIHSDPSVQACQVPATFCSNGTKCTGTCPSFACPARCADGTACTGACSDGSTCAGKCPNNAACNPGSMCADPVTCFTACLPNSGCQTTSSSCPASPNGFLEMSLDIQMAMSMAPGAQIRTYQGMSALPDMATTQPLANQISTSWGMGPITPMMSKAFLEFTVQGQSFSGASGDSGRIIDESQVSSTPAWSDIDGITMVGGTVLSMNGMGASYASEVVWPGSGGWFADGGGIGPTTAIPGYQQGINMAAVGGSNSLRNVPDVAMVATNVEVITNGNRGGVSGTSCASPLWAGFMALVNQKAANIGQPPVGFVNPAIYALAANPTQYAATFNDILPPGNSGGVNGGFNAFVGYDLATGLGAPKCGLINQLPLQPKAVVAVSAGQLHTCAVQLGGRATCWGLGALGDLGNGVSDPQNLLTPTAVQGLTDAASISADQDHTCAVRGTGVVTCWGANSTGELGNGTTTNSAIPVTVAGLNGASALTASSVAVGNDHTCAQLPNGTVACWGNNSFSELGLGNVGQQNVPMTLTLQASLVTMTSTGHHGCVLLSDGSVWCWGLNNFGEVGDGTLTPRNTPVSIAGLGGTKALSANGGRAGTCALLSDGSARCWGQNDQGQIGDGTTTQRLTPATVTGLTGATAISAGFRHTCAVMSGGSISCWGHNQFGELGDGTTTNRLTPVAVQGLGGSAVAVSAGADHTCATLANGNLRCWGENNQGQLGDGTTTNRLTPVTVQF
ncbi:MAG: protease pro-enzyme activation domain-containing protein [Verrucomicrobiota bacterium]